MRVWARKLEQEEVSSLYVGCGTLVREDENGNHS